MRSWWLPLALTLATTVRADTVVVPTYDCVRAGFAVAAGDLAPPTYVRLGTFATPFHDSVVIAVIESANHAQTVTVLGPRQMRSGAIKINAAGANGRPGRAGKASSCRATLPGWQSSSPSRTLEASAVRVVHPGHSCGPVADLVG